LNSSVAAGEVVEGGTNEGRGLSDISARSWHVTRHANTKHGDAALSNRPEKIEPMAAETVEQTGGGASSVAPGAVGINSVGMIRAGQSTDTAARPSLQGRVSSQAFPVPSRRTVSPPVLRSMRTPMTLRLRPR